MRGDAIQFGHRALRWREQDFVQAGVLRSARGGLTGLADDEREHRENDERERDLDRELRDLRCRRRQPELRLRRLNVVGGLSGSDDTCDDDLDLRGWGDAGRATRTLVRDVNLREHEIPHAERRHAVAERVPRPAVRDPRDLRRERLEYFELVQDPADAAVGHLVPGVGLHDERERDRIADGDPALVDRRGDANWIIGRGHRSERQNEEARGDQNAHQLRLDRALKSASSAGTYGRSVERSTRSTPIRLNVRRRCARRSRAARANRSRTAGSAVST